MGSTPVVCSIEFIHTHCSYTIQIPTKNFKEWYRQLNAQTQILSLSRAELIRAFGIRHCRLGIWNNLKPMYNLFVLSSVPTRSTSTGFRTLLIIIGITQILLIIMQMLGIYIGNSDGQLGACCVETWCFKHLKNLEVIK